MKCLSLVGLLLLAGCGDNKELAMNECTQSAATFNKTIIRALYYINLCMELKGYDFVITSNTTDFDILEPNNYH